MPNTLLPREALVYGDQDVEMARHRVEQFAVVEVSPTQFGSGSGLMAGQARAQALRNAGVEEDSHLERLSSYCLGEKRGFGKF